MDHERVRLRLRLTGTVQGVGFRPFVHRLAVAEGLGGFVRNTGEGVSAEIEGPAPAVDRFLARLDAGIRPPASVRTRSIERVPAEGERGFAIVPSALGARRSAVVPPDLATCDDCLAEILDPADRRHLYPFTTCVRCGPRYSLIESMPYDRARTSMRRFAMCAACREEYEDPASRRFHAETNACPECGPCLALWGPGGAVLERAQAALLGAAEALRRGRIVALKGLGGFQLLADARDDAALRLLRERKRRPAKPFAVMPASVEEARALAEISAEEETVLRSSAVPIVLSRARPGPLSRFLAPGSRLVGLMLPYTPLHHLLLRALGSPVVATSGNRGNDPIVTDEHEAVERLAGIADLFLVHDRPILRAVDDSVVRVIGGQAVVFRSARGFAPLPLAGPGAAEPVLALGGHQKSSIAIARDGEIVLGPHVGDLGSGAARAAFARSYQGLTALYGLVPQRIACDEHPDYHSSRIAETIGPPVARVPHHLAHALSGMVDNGLVPPFLAVAWDGTGFGRDGTAWGGEFLVVEADQYRRAGRLLPFRLPGGEAAAREPWRSALGLLHALHGTAALDRDDLLSVGDLEPSTRKIMATILDRGVNAPLTSSAGRLFDGVASLLGLCQRTSFEGEAASALEFTADGAIPAPLPTAIIVPGPEGLLALDWRPPLLALVQAVREGTPPGALAVAFHQVLAEAIVAMAERIGIRSVLLTGGCFQNALLTELAADRLRLAGLEPHWHRSVPPNDGGLAVGQAAFAAHPLAEARA
jgi:hydrogenase maturation protein HypF